MKPLGILLAAWIASAPAAVDSCGAESEVLARGEGVVVTRAHLEEEQKCRMAEVARMKMELPAATVDARILSGLINKHLLLARATDADRSAGLEKFRLNLANHKAALKLSDEAFETRLARRLPLWRLNRARWQERNVENCIMQVVLQCEVEAAVTEDQIKSYYDAHPERFATPETAWTQIIFLGTVDSSTGLALSAELKALKRREADALCARARSGEDFAWLVQGHSELPEARGERAAHALVRGRLAAELEAAAFALRPGQTSEVVASDNGYYIFRSVAKSAARSPALVEVRAQVRASIALRLIPSYLEKLRREAGIAVLDAELAAVAPAEVGDEHGVGHGPEPQL